MTENACGVSPHAFSPHWYALRVLSNRERSVAAALRRLGFSEFLPSYREETRWSDRLKIVDRLLFPGYLFAQFAEYDLPQVLELPGVISVLDSNLRPSAVSDAELENVRLAITSSTTPPVPCLPVAFGAGEAVTIKSGVLRGVSGVVDARSPNGARLVVKVPMLGGMVAVHVAAADLEKTK